ncbi:28S rRNA (cytosine-C(5))-methyltransferase-like [Maniola jurtina]|uniref:28S rRNA (cytosine-C(5))-methyltransferase-like n=1 Tax=Maniola jurtina TaxID=191418 RepID=UPI001E68CE25|nr:28S rRNA (cytosine-C(5))-methyltransferase-like [Maniola jurtina]
MFIHSVSVPKNYKIAANIVQKVSEEGGSFKTLLYDDKLKHFRINVLYALINETIKHAVDIQNLFESTGILVNEPRLNPWLAKVLTAELLYGKKKLPGKSKPEQTILSYTEQFRKLIPEVQDDEKTKVRRPRYVRINTNLLTTSDAIRAFQDEGYKFIRCTSGSYNDYLEQIQKLTEYDFTQDYHVKTIFVFSPGTKLHDHELYLENKIILQDKATALAVHLLAPPPGSVVLDLCAAPGMKTTQLAAYMRNEGKIYAVERDNKRYQTLCQLVEATGSKCVQTLCKDSLQIRRGDLDDVEYILLDPSCSGSGMDLSVHSYVEETRISKLTSLQEKFLKHAMNAFPNAKRIVYSTCSIFPEENERVVTNIVKASRAKWRVKDVRELLKGQWNNFGSGMYGSMGTRCLYAKAESDFTIGFFLAVLDRGFRDSENKQDENKVANDHGEKFKDKIKKRGDGNDTNNEKHDARDDQEKQQTKKKHRDSEYHNKEDGPNLEGFVEGMNEENNIPKNKKKKRNKVSESSVQNEDSHNKTTNNSDEINEKIGKNIDIPNLKKKKRKSKMKDEDNETIINISLNENAESTDKHSKLKDKEENNDNSNLVDFKTDSTNDKKKKKRKHLEEPETSDTKTLLNKNDDERERPKEKKKKCKENKTESLEAVKIPVIDISTEVDSRNTPGNSDILENNYESEMLKKKKKKHKDRINEPKEVLETVNNISREKEDFTENMNDSQIEDETEKPKKVKKKRKERDNESLEYVKDISSDVEQGKTSEKAKKKKNTSQ